MFEIPYIWDIKEIKNDETIIVNTPAVVARYGEPEPDWLLDSISIISKKYKVDIDEIKKKSFYYGEDGSKAVVTSCEINLYTGVVRPLKGVNTFDVIKSPNWDNIEKHLKRKIIRNEYKYFEWNGVYILGKIEQNKTYKDSRLFDSYFLIYNKNNWEIINITAH
jgi:hypothetical protein